MLTLLEKLTRGGTEGTGKSGPAVWVRQVGEGSTPADGKDLMKERENEIPEKVTFIMSWNGLLRHRTGAIQERLASFVTISVAKEIVESQIWGFYTAARQGSGSLGPGRHKGADFWWVTNTFIFSCYREHPGGPFLSSFQ